MISQTLYRKYRPQVFADLAGQNHIRVTLQNQIQQGKVAHAYVFCGPRGVGKTTTARLLAKALNCTTRKKTSPEPCNACESCVSITQGRSMHVLEIDAASNTGVDHVREHIIANAHVAVPEGRTKVFIIDEVHMLSTSAFNALLKTLEEPPDRVVFILATTEVHQLPDTIVSRCQRFDFRKVDVQDLVTRLEQIVKNEGVNCSRDVLERIARFSGGHIRDAESTLWQLFALGEKTIAMEHADLVMPKSDLQTVIQLFAHLTDRKTSDAIELVNTVLLEGGDLPQLTRDMVEFLRKLLLLSVSEHLDQFTLMDVAPALMKNLSARLSRLTTHELEELLKRWIQAQTELSQSEVIQLPLELAALDCIELLGGRVESALPTPPALGPATTPNTSPTLSEQPPVSSDDAPLAATDTLDGPKAADHPDPKQPSDNPPTPVGTSQTRLQDVWEPFLAAIRGHNHSLAMTLQMSKVVSETEGEVTFGFGYQFHCDRVLQPQNKAVIDRVLLETVGRPVTVIAVIEQAVRDTKPENTDVVTPPETSDSDIVTALDVFGGKLVQDRKAGAPHSTGRKQP